MTSPSTDERRENIQKKLAEARAASPSGTLGGATGQSGVAGSYQATGGGETVIGVTPSGKAAVVPYSAPKASRVPKDVVTRGGKPLMVGDEFLTAQKVETERQKELQRRQAEGQARLKAQIISQLGRKTGAFDIQRRTEVPEGIKIATPKEEITVFYTGEEAIEEFGKGREPTAKFDVQRFPNIPQPKVQFIQEFERKAEYPYGRAQRMPISELRQQQREYLYQQQKKAETPEQRALILETTQQLLKGSDKFKALVAQRLSEQKQAYDKTKKDVTAFLGGGRVEIAGDVKPFERKLSGQRIMQEFLTIDTARLPGPVAERAETIKYAIKVGKMPEVAFEYGVKKPAYFIEEKTRFIEDWSSKLPSFKDQIREFRQQLTEELRKPGFQDVPLKGMVERYTRTGRGGLTIAYGGYEGIREKPRRAIAYAGVGFALSPAKALVFGTAAGKGIGLGLAGAYGASVYARAVSEPTEFRRQKRLGQIIATETVPLVAGSMAGKAALASASEYFAPKQIIEVKLADDLTKSEAKFIKQIITKAPPENLLLQEELGYDPDKYVRVDINKLARKPALMQNFIKMQSEGKLETAYEFSLTPKAEGKVGFEIKPRRGVSELEMRASLKASERLSQILASTKAAASLEGEKAVEAARVREMAYEEDVRALMKSKGISAEDALKQIKEAEAEIEWKPIKIQERRSVLQRERAADPTDPFKDMGKALRESQDRFSGLRKAMSGQRQQYVLVEEEQYLRGMRPVSADMEIDVSGVQQYAFLKGLAAESTPLLVPTTMPRLAQISYPKLDIRADIRAATKIGSRMKAMAKTLSLQKPSVMQQTRVDVMADVKAATMTTQMPEVVVETKVQQEQRVDLIPDIRSEQKLLQKFKIDVPEFKEPDAELPRFKLRMDKRMPEYGKGFDVFVGRRGRMQKVNTRPLPFNRAYNFGSDIVDNTVAASFEVRESKKRARGIDDPAWRLKSKFRKPYKKKAKKDFWVEENKHRIDSAGEKKGLSVARYLAQMKKRFFEAM